MAEAEIDVAGRERLGMKTSTADPVLNIIIGNITLSPSLPAAKAGANAVMATASAPAEEPASAPSPTVMPAPTEGRTDRNPPQPPPASSLTVDVAITAALEAMRSSRRVKKTKKALRDCEVAGALFVELMGDMPVSAVTKEVAENLVEKLLTVPAMHGRGKEIRGLPLSTAIALADALDEEASLAAKGDDAPKIPRLSYGTINKCA